MVFDRRQLKAIAAISLPAVVVNITTPLLALTDVAIAGHMGGAVFIAAIAVGGSMFNMLYWLFGFLRMGSSGLTAQAFGAGNRRAAHVVLARALVVALIIGLIMIALQQPLCELLLRMLDVDEPTATLARDYFAICIWGAPASLAMFSLTGWFIGMQNTRLPMWTSLFIDALNIVLSLTFVYGWHWKINGLAAGTLIAQWAGFLLALTLAVRRYGAVRVALRELSEGIGRFFRINSDIFLRTLCLVAVTMWFTRAGASQGPVILAVNALLMQLFTLYSYFMDGLAFAGEAICGRHDGAADRSSLRLAVKAIFQVGGVLAVVFTLGYFLFGETILGVLSSDGDVLRSATEYKLWAVCIPVVGCGAFLWDGIFIGITRTRAMLGSMAAATAVYFILYFLLQPRLGNHGLWIAFLAYLLTRGLVLTFVAKRRRILQDKPR